MSSPHANDAESRSDAVLTVAEVAQKYRTTPRTVQRWIREDKLRAIRLPGGDYRVRQEDLDAAIEASA